MGTFSITHLAILMTAVAVIATPAFAQSWMEYAYPDLSFAAQFPQMPQMEMGTYVTADGKPAPATIYSYEEGKTIYKVTVADYTALPQEQMNAIDDAVRQVASNGNNILVTVNSRISGQYGKELTAANKDGSRSIMAVFYFGNRLYELDARVLPPNPQAGSADAIRFQQSLRFTGAGGRFGGGFGRPRGGGFGRRGGPNGGPPGGPPGALPNGAPPLSDAPPPAP